MQRIFFALLLFCCTLGAAAQLPATVLRDLDGRAVRTDTLSNAGRPIIISFFATWCKPCNRELSAIADVYDEWREETGVRLIAVSIDEAQNSERVRPFVDGKGWTYDVLLDPNSNFRRALNVSLIPHVFILDGKGKIAYSRSGYTEEGQGRQESEERKDVFHGKAAENQGLAMSSRTFSMSFSSPPSVYPERE